MLAPVPVDVFFRDYWDRKPLHVRGSREKIERFLPGGFSRADFLATAALAAERQVPGFRLTAHRTGGYDHEGAHDNAVHISPKEAMAFFAAGANLQMINPYHERGTQLICHLKTQLGLTGEAVFSATLSPSGFGWPAHFDRAGVIFVQCEGRKRFLLGEAPAFPSPRGSVMFDASGRVASYAFDAREHDHAEDIDLDKLTEFVLEPGDILYCPTGVVHGTKALDESLTLLLQWEPTFPQDIIDRALRAELLSSPAWRNLPSSAWPREGDLPSELQAFFAQRLVELRRAVAKLTAAQLGQHYYQALALASPGALAILKSPAGLGRSIRRNDVFRVGGGTPVTWCNGTDAHGKRCLYLFTRDRELTISGEWLPFVRELVKQEAFSAGDAAHWGRAQAWRDVQETLASLVEQGVISLVDGS